MGEPHVDVCPVRGVVQFLPTTHDAQDDTCGRRGIDGRAVDDGAAVERIGESERSVNLAAWDMAVCGTLLVPPAVVLVSIIVSTDKRVRMDEGICLLSIPLTIYHVFGLFRFAPRLPHV